MATPSNKPRDIKDLKARLGRTMTPGTPGQVGGSAPPGPGASFRPRRSERTSPDQALACRVVCLCPVPRERACLRRRLRSLAIEAAAAAGSTARRAAGSVAASARGGPARRRPVRLRGCGSDCRREEGQARHRRLRHQGVRARPQGRRRATSILVRNRAGAGRARGSSASAAPAPTSSSTRWPCATARTSTRASATVSKSLEVAQGHLRTAVEASQGGPGKQAGVDYKAIEDLRAMERPFSAAEFSRRRYLAFPTPVVDDLFEYYNNINLLWDKFELLEQQDLGRPRSRVARQVGQGRGRAHHDRLRPRAREERRRVHRRHRRGAPEAPGARQGAQGRASRR